MYITVFSYLLLYNNRPICIFYSNTSSTQLPMSLRVCLFSKLTAAAGKELEIF